MTYETGNYWLYTDHWTIGEWDGAFWRVAGRIVRPGKIGHMAP